jgi:hypothetical protein
MMIRIHRHRRVTCRATVDLPMSASVAWGQLRDFRTTAAHDPFHVKIEIECGVPRAGAPLKILHRYLLLESMRVGRILRWREGSGFAFSDLCRTDASRAFPHVLSYELEPISQNACRLHIYVGGKWTPYIPPWMGQLWLRWVFSQLVRTAENQLLRFALAMRLNAKA